MAHNVEARPRIVRLKTVIARTGLARSTVYDRLNPDSPRYDDAFPRPFKIGKSAVGWLESEVDEWILATISHRR